MFHANYSKLMVLTTFFNNSYEFVLVFFDGCRLHASIVDTCMRHTSIYELYCEKASHNVAIPPYPVL